MVSRRALEIATAALTGAFGVAIVVSSAQSGVGWSRAGVGAGTFPLIAGVLMVAGSLYNLVRGALAAHEVAIDRPTLTKVAWVFIVAALFVAAIPFLGLHVAAALYVLYSARSGGKTSWPKAIALAVATPVILYATFDWGFTVQLPRGMLGAAFGL